MVKIIHSGWAYSSESPRRCKSESDIFIKVVYTSDSVNAMAAHAKTRGGRASEQESLTEDD